jgi:Holliday junction resolvasome RuvABC endonuclease subunit
MSYSLGLDISTSCTGWCIIGSEGAFVDMGYVSLDSKLSSFQKARVIRDELSKLHISHDITRVFIEENLQAFRPGFSSAKTLLTLARFNGIVSYIAQLEFYCVPEYINVNVARKSVGLKVISKKKGGKPTKEQVLDWVTSKVVFEWPTKTLKSGPRKGIQILEPGCFDMADAFVIAQAGTVLVPYDSLDL